MRENIDAQKELLETIKIANAYDMDKPFGGESESIAEKVRASREIAEGEVVNLAVSVGKVKDEKGDDAGERVWV